MRRALAGLVLCVLLSGCGDPFELGSYRRDIVSVWKHDINNYSVSYLDGTRIVDDGFYSLDGVNIICNMKPNTMIVVDVPKGMTNWCEAVFYKYGLGGVSCKATIHIQSVDDVGGGGWNHGKFGSGMTERIDKPSK